MLARNLLVLLTLAPLPFAWSQSPTPRDSIPVIDVTGEAVVKVVPDKIVVTFGIETNDHDITIAKEKNNDVLKQALDAIKALGVPDKEIQTDHLSIEPRYRHDYPNEVFLGYFVRNSFVVTLTETDKVEQLVTVALDAGVNYVHGLDFQSSEFKKHREQARVLALQAAKEKAEKMTAVLDMQVGEPIRIHEQHSGSPWYYSHWSGWGYGRGGGMSQNMVQNIEGDGEIADTIALGKISIRARVNVAFEIKGE